MLLLLCFTIYFRHLTFHLIKWYLVVTKLKRFEHSLSLHKQRLTTKRCWNIFHQQKYFYIPMLQCWSPLRILISQYLNNCNECNPGESVAVPSQPGLSASIQCLMVMSNVSIHILLSQIRYSPYTLTWFDAQKCYDREQKYCIQQHCIVRLFILQWFL